MTLTFDVYDGDTEAYSGYIDREDYAYGVDRQRRLDREEERACAADDKHDADRDERLIAEMGC